MDKVLIIDDERQLRGLLARIIGKDRRRNWFLPSLSMRHIRKYPRLSRQFFQASAFSSAFFSACICATAAETFSIIPEAA